MEFKKNKKFKLHFLKVSFVLCVTIVLICPKITRAQNVLESNFETILKNICQVQWMDAPSNVLRGATVKSDLERQSLDGSWPDIDYGSHRQTAWNPSTHLLRLHKMILAYTYPSGPMFNDIRLKSGIENGLLFWYNADPRSSNWWNQQIFCPKQIGEILILLRSITNSISSDLENKLLVRMKEIGGDPEGRYSEGGSNRVNIAAHWIYRGCLTKDKAVLAKGIKNYLLPLTFCEPGRGLQNDYSFQEHGRQLYIGNYGYSFISNMTEGALFLRNTPWALSSEQIQLLSVFMRKTYLNSVRGQYNSFSIPGRQIANKDALSRVNTTALLDRMSLIDIANKRDYITAKERWSGVKSPNYEVGSWHKHYWLSDYTFHNRKDYNFDVRFVSTKTVRTENVNYENKKGFFLSDGGTNMTIRGDEYFNIFPVWDWCKIPGTTAPLLDSLPDLRQGVGGFPGKTQFCGGVSDSENGVSTYQLDYPQFQIKGNKSWFFFDKEIVCLGNDIQSSFTNNKIGTTINQCQARGKVVVCQNNVVSTLSNDFSDNKLDKSLQWVLHDGFGYMFPQSGNVFVSDKQQQGSWKRISDSQKDEVVKEKVFTLWMDHGIEPHNANYAYIVVPNIKNPSQMKTYEKESAIKIICNTDSIQQVYDANSQLKEVVLYRKYIQIELDSNYSISFDQPCLVMIKPISGKWLLHIADPTLSLKEIVGTLTSKETGKNKTILFILPSTSDLGSSMQQIVEP